MRRSPIRSKPKQSTCLPLGVQLNNGIINLRNDTLEHVASSSYANGGKANVIGHSKSFTIRVNTEASHMLPHKTQLRLSATYGSQN